MWFKEKKKDTIWKEFVFYYINILCRYVHFTSILSYNVYSCIHLYLYILMYSFTYLFSSSFLDISTDKPLPTMQTWENWEKSAEDKFPKTIMQLWRALISVFSLLISLICSLNLSYDITGLWVCVQIRPESFTRTICKTWAMGSVC